MPTTFKHCLAISVSLILLGMACSLPGSSAGDESQSATPKGEARVETPGCAPGDCIATSEPGSIFLPVIATPMDQLLLREVNDFLYQLQNIDLQAIGQTAYDLVILDYSADGSGEQAFSAPEIEGLKHSPGGEKIVLAYMSIGEAENYRFYWQDAWDANLDGVPDLGAPDWLDEQNPDWEGNYKVRYWDPDWQALILEYTDYLLEASFDGAYLDIVDAYEFYLDQGRSSAPGEMRDFVASIRAYARQRDPDFLIVPQNAVELASLLPDYLQSVDGIGQEDLYFGYDGDNLPTPPEVSAALEANLDLYILAGKTVLTTDYAWSQANIDDAYQRAHDHGYQPFVTVRDLDQLTINPGHPPD